LELSARKIYPRNHKIDNPCSHVTEAASLVPPTERSKLELKGTSGL
jgi:hypothetical protein